MHGFRLILLILLLTGTAAAQAIRVSGPDGPVEAGNSFRIQFIVEAPAAHELLPPAFSPFRLVEGPDIYPGKPAVAGLVNRNYVYTLEAAAPPGRYTVLPALLRFNGSTLSSLPLQITVLPAGTLQPASGEVTAYYLRPGEQAADKVKDNLFVRLTTDKTECRVGEPVVATFRLYSRLESRSQVIKNPGFYGFTVQDMITMQDQQKSTALINGREFDVHTIRKVQLYPLQAGEFTIDPMVMKNRVEFSRTIMNRKTSQQIAEGLYGADMQDEQPAAGTELVENEISTNPLRILVKSLPASNRPASYSGAVGRFSVHTTLLKNTLKRNEEGFLLLSVEGNGNFSQLTSPQILWPEGLEGFTPDITDTLDKLQVPLQGKRIFRYGFIANRPGEYTIPAIQFSYFNNDSNRYVVLQTKALAVTVSNELAPEKEIADQQVGTDFQGDRRSRIALLVVVLLVVLVMVYWVLRKKPVEPDAPVPPPLTAADWLQPLDELPADVDPEVYYNTLLGICWNWASARFGLGVHDRHKKQLAAELLKRGADTEPTDRFIHLLQICETSVYAPVLLTDDKALLRQEAGELIDNLERQLF